MATVYLARDVRHGRQVALKVLKPELGAVLGAERFLTEIQVTAQLQHPNLLPLFDSGEAAGLLFYVMPFVEGETLRARLDRERQLPLDEVLRLTAALAAALQYAHERGVIHRDLKPENILLQAGQPVIADFGIALAVSNAGGARVTQTGLSLGTPQYMSPEQAAGDRAIDARTDVYSLAAMTYEMLTGEPPHAGSTAQAIIAKLMTEEPRPVSVLRKSVPLHVEAAIARALEKLPADRLPSAAAFAAAVSGEKQVAPTSAQRAAAASSARPRWREGAAWATAAALTVALGAALWPRDSAAPVSPIAGRFEVDFPDSLIFPPLVLGPKLAISANGRVLVAVAATHNGRQALWMRTADDPTFAPIPGTGGASFPSLSPDGSSIAFSDERGTVRKQSLTGGGASTLYAPPPAPRDSAPEYVTRRASWGPDDRMLIEGPAGSIVLLSTSGGAPRTVIAADSVNDRRRRFLQPAWLPGGTHALVTVRSERPAAEALPGDTIFLLDVGNGTVRSLGVQGSSPRYARLGYLLFMDAGRLMAVPFSASSHAVTGTPTVLLDSAGQVAVADNGWLVASSNQPQAKTRQVVLVDASGRERPLGDDRHTWRVPRVSPDGRRIVLQEACGNSFYCGDLWVMDIATGAVSHLVSEGQSYRPKWSRDGRYIYYLQRALDVHSLFRRPWDGSGTEELIRKDAPGVSLAEIEPGPLNGLSAIRTFEWRDILLAPTDSLSGTRPFVSGPSNETHPAISPDGRWLAYQSDESGPMEIYLRPVPGPGARLSVSTRGGVQPRWSSDGRRLYFRSPQAVMSAELQFRDGTAVVTRRDSLFADRFASGGDDHTYDVLPDGSGFVFLRGPAETRQRQRLTLIANWPALLRAEPKER